MAAALFVLWVPATSLCLLENAGLVSKKDDCPASQSESSPCCALASATYKTEPSPAAVPPPAPLPGVLLDLPKLISTRLQSAVAESGVSPPELSQTWQFSFRAALAPRAPSSGS
jgi:hypothetical protein